MNEQPFINDRLRRLAVGVGGGVLAWCLTATLVAAEEDMPPGVAGWRVTGVGSCTAAGCHGAARLDRGVVGSEYNVWITRDPHARAYSVLFDERSQRMAELLANLDGGQFTPAHEDPRCLACHSMKDPPARDPTVNVVSDGVGCESCHGPAEGWLAVHVEGKLSPDEKARLGMWDTDRLLTRTQVCVRCHVGGAKEHGISRDVNHDLIAAGHPRLEFEMGAYHEALPKHWDDAADRSQHGADFDALMWALGQACTSQAAVAQLANRAERGPNWPEFSEWSCAACHHDLRDDLARQERLAAEDNLSGQRIAWDTWNHYASRRHAADVSRAFGADADAAAGIDADLRSLDDLMRQLNPNRSQVAEQARSASQRLGRWAASLEHARLDRRRLDWLTRAVVGGQAQMPLSDWSAAAQTYDALASLHETRLRHAAAPSDERLTRAIRRLYDELAARQRAPRGYQFQPQRVRAQLIEVERLLRAEGGEG
jgi:hypothetical protein